MSTPAAYEHTTETHESQQSSGRAPIGPQTGYLNPKRGLLRISEIFLSLLMLICASVDYWSHLGGGWVQFVAAAAMVGTTILFFLFFLNIVASIPLPWNTVELSYNASFCLLLFISFVVCCFRAHLTAAIGAATFFNLATLIVFVIDTYFVYQAWQANRHVVTSSTTTTTHTTVSTSYETPTQY